MPKTSEEVSIFPTKILLAADGSKDAELATATAVGLAKSTSSKLDIVHVFVMPSKTLDESLSFDNSAREAPEEKARAKLEELVGKTETFGGAIEKSHFRMGQPDVEIVALAEELGAGLVVVGSRGHSPRKRALMGSVSESVVRHAHCSVLVVRGSGSGEDRDYLPGCILLAFDGSKDTEAAARAALEISNVVGSELHVLCVVQLPYAGPFAWEVDVEKIKQNARSMVDRQAQQIEATRGKVKEVHLASGKPYAEIVRFAEELGAGLVVMGTRGFGRLQRALMGSISESVVRHAHCPVMVVRPEKSRRREGA